MSNNLKLVFLKFSANVYHCMGGWCIHGTLSITGVPLGIKRMQTALISANRRKLLSTCKPLFYPSI
jgi:hypothetical protein